MHERIQLARTSAGFNKSELSRTLNVTPTSCSSWELPPENRNASRPSVDNLGRLALILNVRFEWIATGRGSMRTALTGTRSGTTAKSQQTRLLAVYRSLPARQRGSVLGFLKIISGQTDSETRPTPHSSRRAAPPRLSPRAQ